MKTHNISKTGAVGLAVVAATILGAPGVFTEKVKTTGNIIKEVVCTGQDLTGGMVQVAQNCAATADPPAPTGPSPDVTGG